MPWKYLRITRRCTCDTLCAVEQRINDKQRFRNGNRCIFYKKNEIAGHPAVDARRWFYSASISWTLVFLPK